MTAVQELREAVAGLGAATMHEACATSRIMDGRIRPVDVGQVVTGLAFPVSTAAGHNIWLHRAIAAAPAGSVLVVEVAGEAPHGYWGEIMSTAAIERELAGLVIDGCVRDHSSLVALDFPVFATGLCVRGTRKDPTAGGGLVHSADVGEALVAAGDFIIGDTDGVVVIPADDIATATDAARARAAEEAEVLARLRKGATTLEVYGWD